MAQHPLDPRRPMKAVIYAASSQELENAAERQHEHIEDLLKKLDYPWDVVKAYVDKGFSPRDRPALREMVGDIKTGMAVDVILVDSLDRLGRSKNDVATLCQELFGSYGVSVRTADTGFAFRPIHS